MKRREFYERGGRLSEKRGSIRTAATMSSRYAAGKSKTVATASAAPGTHLCVCLCVCGWVGVCVRRVSSPRCI